MVTDTFTTDGINKTYPTTKKFRSGYTLLFLNGIYQGLGRDYTEDSGHQSISFLTVPAPGLEAEIRYLDEDLRFDVGISTFKEQLVIDAVNTFVNIYEFAETITYTPKDGVGKLMPAIIDRSQISPAGEDTGRILKNQVNISIANNDLYGVISIIKGADKVSLPERIGGSNVDFLVADILRQDEGMWELLLVK
jgi:hypothetical protein